MNERNKKKIVHERKLSIVLLSFVQVERFSMNYFLSFIRSSFVRLSNVRSYHEHLKGEKKRNGIVPVIIIRQLLFFPVFFFTERSVRIAKSVILRHRSYLETVRQKKKRSFFMGRRTGNV